MQRLIFSLSAITLFAFFFISCTKDGSDGNNSSYKVKYADSIIYLKNQSTDYIVSPVDAQPGTYTGFPDGIQIDDNTGAINVSKSETGLRYRITYHSPSGDSSSTMVVLSGITFTDKFYHLSTGDSIAFPVYNAALNRVLPVSGSNFDDGNTANSGGCAVRTDNGKINLAQTVRNGVFGTIPQNDVRRDFDIDYRLNDASGKSLNKLRVRVYYYERMSDVPADLLQTLQDRQDLGVFLGMNSYINYTPSTARTTATARVAKPRPPCVIIVNQ